MITDQTVTYEHLAELRHLRAVHHRAAHQFYLLDEGVHSGSRPHPTLVRLRDAANDEAEAAWSALKRYEHAHPDAVRVLNALEQGVTT